MTDSLFDASLSFAGNRPGSAEKCSRFTGHVCRQRRPHALIAVRVRAFQGCKFGITLLICCIGRGAMGHRLQAIWSAAIRVFCAVALVCSVFAHQMPSVNAAPNEVQTLGVMPDGTPITICKADQDGKKDNSAKGGICQFCSFASGLDLPAPPPVLSNTLAQTLLITVAPGAEIVRPLPSVQAASPRGPPVSV